MNTYTVIVQERHEQHVTVDAESAEEATMKVRAGEGHYNVPSHYAATLDVETWHVELDDG